MSKRDVFNLSSYTNMNCTQKFSHVAITFNVDPTRPVFNTGEYLFAFKYFTRQVGWGIETYGKYPTEAAPSSANQVQDGWPTPFVKESELTHPYRATPTTPWNIVTFTIYFCKNPGSFVNIGYYMAQDPDNEFGHGQIGSGLGLVGAMGSRWQKISERPSSVTINTVKF